MPNYYNRKCIVYNVKTFFLDWLPTSTFRFTFPRLHNEASSICMAYLVMWIFYNRPGFGDDFLGIVRKTTKQFKLFSTCTSQSSGVGRRTLAHLLFLSARTDDRRSVRVKIPLIMLCIRKWRGDNNIKIEIAMTQTASVMVNETK